MTDIIQGSPEWFQIRCGKLTASRMADATAKTKTGWGAGRKNLMAQLVAERLTGAVAESYSNAAMQWGTDTEPEARAAYEFYQGVDVVEIGFIDHPTIPMTGCSPDGLVGDDGMVEIKCPNTSTHIDTLLKGSIPSKYIKQMQWQMACAERDWCDFVSYDPRMPEEMKLFVSRVELGVGVRVLTSEAIEFLKDLADQVLQLQSKYQPDEEPNILLGG
ncbi:MAG: YqaJ viral recombinase family protein [Chloroflexi bacterium]|nr:YqaJ viral recombinase family protein [Chloroflexota bacterium]